MSLAYYEIDGHARHEAKKAHEWFMGNIALVNIVLPVLLLKFGDPHLALGVPMLISGIWMGLTYLRVQLAWKKDPWFVAIHWQQSLERYKLLIIGYLIALLVTFIKFVVAPSSEGMMQANPFEVILTFFSIIPAFFLVLTAFVLESGAMFDVSKSAISLKLTQRFPPPSSCKAILPKGVQ